MADAVVELQELLSLRGATGVAGVIQEMPLWVETTGYTTAVVRSEHPMLGNATLVVEGCDVQGGAFTTLAAFTQSAAAASYLYLSVSAPYGTAERLPTLIRWRIDASLVAEWNVTFRLMLVLKA